MRTEVHPLEQRLPHDVAGLPREQLITLQDKARRLGLWALQIPERFGGAGLSVLGQVVDDFRADVSMIADRLLEPNR